MPLVRGRYHLTTPSGTGSANRSTPPSRTSRPLQPRHGVGVGPDRRRRSPRLACLPSGADRVRRHLHQGHRARRGHRRLDPTHSWACLCSAPAARAVPAKVGAQSTDGTTTAIAASAAFRLAIPAYKQPHGQPSGLPVGGCVRDGHGDAVAGVLHAGDCGGLRGSPTARPRWGRSLPGRLSVRRHQPRWPGGPGRDAGGVPHLSMLRRSRAD